MDNERAPTSMAVTFMVAFMLSKFIFLMALVAVDFTVNEGLLYWSRVRVWLRETRLA